MDLSEVEVRRMPLSELHPAEYNPRRISDEALAGLSGSLAKFGVLAAIVWNKRTGNIVGGHQRYRCLIEAGATETDVVVVDLDDNEEIALNITLNNPHVRGDFTVDVMRQLRECSDDMPEEFAGLGLADLYGDLKKMGYEKKEKKAKDKEKPPAEVENETDSAEGACGSGGKKPKSYACITCPACGSKWRMDDGSVVSNGVTGDEAAMEEVLRENGITD